MTRPTLTLTLSSVLAAQVDGADRPGLLATLHPEFGRAVDRRPTPAEPGMAQVIPLPRVIPMPRQHRPDAMATPEQPDLEPDPTSAA